MAKCQQLLVARDQPAGFPPAASSAGRGASPRKPAAALTSIPVLLDSVQPRSEGGTYLEPPWALKAGSIGFSTSVGAAAGALEDA